MTEEELNVRKSLKKERLNRLYLERMHYTGDIREMVIATGVTIIGACIIPSGFYVYNNVFLKVLTGVAEVIVLGGAGCFVYDTVKSYKNQEAKEAEITALEAQNPEDIDLEESYQPVLTINHKN